MIINLEPIQSLTYYHRGSFVHLLFPYIVMNSYSAQHFQAAFLLYQHIYRKHRRRQRTKVNTRNTKKHFWFLCQCKGFVEVGRECCNDWIHIQKLSRHINRLIKGNNICMYVNSIIFSFRSFKWRMVLKLKIA